MSAIAADELATLRARMREAQDAWRAECDKRLGNTPELLALVGPMMRLEREYRLAKAGISRATVPIGHEMCGRCGGYGGSSAWPGWVCFDCGGLGAVPS